jgi:hypothetical protein
MKRYLTLIALAAVAALCVVATASASTPLVKTPGVGVKAIGTVRTHDWKGTLTGFELMYGITKKPTLVYRSASGVQLFRSVTLKATAMTTRAVRFTGVGLAHGKRVPFHAIVVMHQTAGDGSPLADRFGLAWNHGQLFGGHLLSGAVRISLPLSKLGSKPPKAI